MGFYRVFPVWPVGLCAQTRTASTVKQLSSIQATRG